MANIRIKMKNGKVREFMHRGRAGGSHTKTLRYEEGFVVVTDEYYHETAIPTEDIEQVEKWPNRNYF